MSTNQAAMSANVSVVMMDNIAKMVRHMQFQQFFLHAICASQLWNLSFFSKIALKIQALSYIAAV